MGKSWKRLLKKRRASANSAAHNEPVAKPEKSENKNQTKVSKPVRSSKKAKTQTTKNTKNTKKA